MRGKSFLLSAFLNNPYFGGKKWSEYSIMNIYEHKPDIYSQGKIQPFSETGNLANVILPHEMGATCMLSSNFSNDF